MKRIILSFCLAISTLTASNASLAVTHFSAAENAKVRLPNLDYPTIIKQFYAGKYSKFVANVDNSDEKPLYSVKVTNGKNEDVLAIYQPVVTYQNTQGETRYLIVIEKPYFDDNNRLGQTMGFGSPADVFTFRKLQSNQYQLVSRSIDGKSFEGVRGFSSL